ncbi:hypothetical protein FQN52_008309 [Onygenales sp. PD_12]|nr:hypothetical protein FQN52_008309 [Onygenales sp. PD_12]KAK2804759.1 hypothetical protein FQN51_001400 [Onygenales sp. PD_10]
MRLIAASEAPVIPQKSLPEPFDGFLPENNNRDLKALLIPEGMATKHRFDVVFQRDYKPPEVSDWEEPGNPLLSVVESYSPRANAGPRLDA